MMIILVLIILFASLTIADFVITNIALKIGAIELNPIARLYVFNPNVAMVVNAIAIIIVSIASYEIYQRSMGLAIAVLSLLIIVRGYVVYRNMRVILIQ